MNIDQRLQKVFTMKKPTKLFALAALLLCGVPGAQAQDDGTHRHHDDIAGMAPAPASMSTGEVTKVDKEAGRITLRHGALENLGMPGMTMAFKVAQPGMMEQVKPGDKVRFVAEKAGGALTIMTLQHAQ